MIDKKDLRIGNSVMLEGKILTVKAIEHNPVTDRWYVKVYENYSQIKCEYLEPIPLTEELLVKCGFQYLNGRTDGELTLDILHYEFDFVEGELVTKSRYEEVYKREKLPHIKSLHQLQNLYFALTKQELTIEIN